MKKVVLILLLCSSCAASVNHLPNEGNFDTLTPSQLQNVRAYLPTIYQELINCNYLAKKQPVVLEIIRQRYNHLVITGDPENPEACAEAVVNGEKIAIAFYKHMDYRCSFRYTFAHELLHIGGMSHATELGREKMDLALAECGFGRRYALER